MARINDLADEYRSYVLQLARTNNVNADDDFENFCKKINLPDTESLCAWREWCDADRDATISNVRNESESAEALHCAFVNLEAMFDRIIEESQVNQEDDWIDFNKKVDNCGFGWLLSVSDRILCYQYLLDVIEDYFYIAK